MANRIEYGLEQVHIAFFDNPATPTWNAPIWIAGALEFTATPEEEEMEVWADNGLYFSNKFNKGYTGEVDFSTIEDSVLAQIFDWPIDANGAIVERTNSISKPFALMAQVEGDDRNRRFVYYNCIAGRPSKEHKTSGETVDPQTQPLTLKMTPIDIDDVRTSFTALARTDANATAYNNFFNSVYTPVWPELSYSATEFNEDGANDGSIDEIVTVTLANATFAGDDDNPLDGVVATGVPTGLTFAIEKKTATTAEISFTDEATSHAASDSTTFSVVFGDDAFTLGNAGTVKNREQDFDIVFTD